MYCTKRFTWTKLLDKPHSPSGTHARWHTRKKYSRSRITVQSRIVTPLRPYFSNNAAFVSLIPAVLVQDRFVSTSTVIDTIIVAHVLVTLSSVYLNRWRTKLVICVSHSQGNSWWHKPLFLCRHARFRWTLDTATRTSASIYSVHKINIQSNQKTQLDNANNATQ